MAHPIRQDRDARGELFIWTNIDPAHEDEFNQWYDREHMAERAAIPGFLWARRYRAQAGPRRYLALYGTQDLHVFGSAAYRQAFENQTQWSLLNFSRMRDTIRRVAAVTTLAGAGTGGAIALLPLADLARAEQAARLAAGFQAQAAGLLALRVLVPDAELSTPLPSEDVTTRVLEPLLVVDAVSEASAQDAARALVERLALAPDGAQVFRLLWELRADDLRCAPPAAGARP